LMSKPMLVTVPLVLLLLDYWPLSRLSLQHFNRNNVRRLLVEKCPFLALSLFSSIITFLVQHRGGSVSTTLGLPIEARFANAAIAYGGYLWKTFWPAHLCIFYPHPGAHSDLFSGL